MLTSELLPEDDAPIRNRALNRLGNALWSIGAVIIGLTIGVLSLPQWGNE